MHQLFIVGKVDGDFGIEKEGMMSTFHPLNDFGQNFFAEFVLVADEVVVDEKHAPPPPPRVQAVEFFKQLIFRLCPRDPAIKHCDVAEIAIVRASA